MSDRDTKNCHVDNARIVIIHGGSPSDNTCLCVLCVCRNVYWFPFGPPRDESKEIDECLHLDNYLFSLAFFPSTAPTGMTAVPIGMEKRARITRTVTAPGMR